LLCLLLPLLLECAVEGGLLYDALMRTKPYPEAE
jgi:hypothetical protein